MGNNRKGLGFRTEAAKQIVEQLALTQEINTPAERILALKALEARTAKFLQEEEVARTHPKVANAASYAGIATGIGLVIASAATLNLALLGAGVVAIYGTIGMDKWRVPQKISTMLYDRKYSDAAVVRVVAAHTKELLAEIVASGDVMEISRSPKAQEVFAQVPTLKERFLAAVLDERGKKDSSVLNQPVSDGGKRRFRLD